MSKFGEVDTTKKTGKRKPSNTSYFAEKRWIKNKTKRIRKHLKQMELDKKKKITYN